MTSILLATRDRRGGGAGDSCLGPVRRVVLIDPRPERLAIMSLLIEQCRALTVVGSAASLDEAEPRIRAKGADVALIEIQMPVTEGLKAIATLRDKFPALRIIVCSFHNDASTRAAAQESGADGYLAKPLELAELLTLVRSPARSDGTADALTGAPVTVSDGEGRRMVLPPPLPRNDTTLDQMRHSRQGRSGLTSVAGPVQ